MNRIYGQESSVVPDHQAHFGFREQKIKKKFGIKDEFDKFVEKRAHEDEINPPVKINQALVFVDKRAQNSNQFMKPYDKFVMNRRDIRSKQQSEYSKKGVSIHKWPKNSRDEHFVYNENQGFTKYRKVMM
jgi:hypothetical protein